MRFKRMCLVLAIGGASCGGAPAAPKAVSPCTAAEPVDDQGQVVACRGRPGDHYDLSSVICIDARTPGRMTQLRSVTERGDSDKGSPQITLPPNHTIIVHVLTGGHKISGITLGGNGGQTIAELIGSPSDAKGALGGTSDAQLGSSCTEPWLFCAKFVPRTPGVARLRITLEPEAKPKGVELDVLGVFALRIGEPSPPPAAGKQFDFEYLVPRIYAGAIRAGLSAVVGVQDVAYTSAAHGGGTAGVVSELPSSRFTSEVVVGYSPFWESFGQRGGRDYVHPLTWTAYSRFAPYFGLGVVSAAPSSDGGTKAAWLRSAYVGVEYELFQGVSLAATAVIRRAEQRAAGIRVGDVVPAGTALTDTTTRFGFGLVLNVTPDFFKVAASVGAK